MPEKNHLSAEDEVKLATSFGFTSHLDRRRGGTWCSFSKGDERVWASRYWMRARITDNRYINHKCYGSLEDALKEENAL